MTTLIGNHPHARIICAILAGQHVDCGHCGEMLGFGDIQTFELVDGGHPDKRVLVHGACYADSYA